MKRKFFMLTLALIVFGAVFYIFNNDTGNRFYKYDFSQRQTFTSSFLGITFKYPSSLVEDSHYGYFKDEEENLAFYHKSSFDGAESKYLDEIFSVHLEYEMFDPDNISETTPSKDSFREVPAFSLLQKVNAMPPPEIIKIQNIDEVRLGTNTFYTYAFKDNHWGKVDVFILPRNYDDYVSFRFYDESKEFISEILSTVEMNEPDSYLE